MSESERWKWCVGYEGSYQVSDLGRVRSVDRVIPHNRGGLRRLKGKILLAVAQNRYGHLGVNLCKEGFACRTLVHRIVAATWIGPCPQGQQVRHGPAGKLDNSVSNLSYGTPSEDGFDKRRDGTHGGRAVRRSDGREFPSLVVAAEETGCHSQNICIVCKGQVKTAGGFGWEYI